MPARRAISASRTWSMPASMISSRAAWRMRSRLRCPSSVLAGPRRRVAGAVNRAACSGETMRLMAGRTGPAGTVLGIDADSSLGAMALATLHAAGHRQCSFQAHDLTAGEPIPGAPFGLVYARLLLFHLPQRVEVLARLWDAVAPGGHLVVQDYDLRGVSVLPALASVDDLERVITGAFHAVGADVYVGARLPQLFLEAGIGYPDGTDVAGRSEERRVGKECRSRWWADPLENIDIDRT